MIYVTKTFLPPQEEYQAILGRAWNKGWITNRGELVQELEEKLKSYLGVDGVIATTNGTLPLQIAIKTLGLKGEIITTPFSYVATTSSIVWENCRPVFVDMDREYFSIDETQIEAAITGDTTAILATHVFGNPCDLEKIEAIAKKHGLKVIYDAAHCFGVQYKGRSVFTYGDVSTCSFHATKLFHTGEGGAIFAKDSELLQELYYHHNFGHKGQEDFHGLGINAKMSEMQGAMGLAVLPYIDHLIAERKKAAAFYDEHLQGLQKMRIREGSSRNYSYYPVVFSSEEQMLRVKKALNEQHIFPRRYFYPSLNLLNYLEYREMPVSEDISARILCLPIWHEFDADEIKKIIDVILQNL